MQPLGGISDRLTSPSPARGSNYQGSIGATAPALAAGLNTPWAFFGAHADRNDHLANPSLANRTAPPDPNGNCYHVFAPSPTGAYAPPGPARGSIIVNVQSAAPQKKYGNPPWSAFIAVLGC